MPGSAPAKRRLSVPLPQENIFSRSSDASSNASSSSRRPSYVSALLSGSGKTFQKLKTRFRCNFIYVFRYPEPIVYFNVNYSFGQIMFPILTRICEYDEGHDIIFRAYNRKEIRF